MVATPSQTKNEEDANVPWHPAFVQALKMELIDYHQYLNFQAEYPLTTDPLRIDIVTTKDPAKTKIEKNIGQIFLRVNIFEYKRPDDSLTVDSYNKVFGYAYLYAAFNSIPISDITISFVVTKYPRDLTHYIEGRKNIVLSSNGSGIYYISGEVFPVQIIESKKLDRGENLWPQSLSDKVTIQTMQDILQKHKSIRDEELSAYLYALVLSNPKIIKEVRALNAALLDEVLDEMGLTDVWSVEKEKDRLVWEKNHVQLIADERAKLLEEQENLKLRQVEAMLQDGQLPETISRWMNVSLNQVLRISEKLEV